MFVNDYPVATASSLERADYYEAALQEEYRKQDATSASEIIIQRYIHIVEVQHFGGP